MECERFKSHVTDENINKGHAGEHFELVLGKFILHRLIQRGYDNFRLTREKKGCGKFDDLAFSYDSDEGQEKYCLVQLKCKSDEAYKISYEDLTSNLSSYFLLPFYYDHYIESLNSIKDDNDLKSAELEELIICTNVGIDYLSGPISLQPVQNSGLFSNSGNLYKLFIKDPKKRKEIFHDQFLSDRKRLSKELVICVMLKKSVNLQSMFHDQTFSLIKTYYKMIIEDVIDVKSKKFRDSFLTFESKELNQELLDFRGEFFDSLIEFYERFKDEDCETLKKLIDFGKFKNVTDYNSKVNTLKSLLKCFGTDKKAIVKFLKSREIVFTGVPNEHDRLKIYPTSSVYNHTDEKILLFLNLLTFAVDQVDNEKIISQEINNLSVYKGFNIYMENWYYKGTSPSVDFTKSKVNYRKWITKQDLLEELGKSSISFQNENIKFQDICITPETITPEALMFVFSENADLSIGKTIEKEHIQFYIERKLTQRKKVSTNVFMEIPDGFCIVALDKTLDLTHLQKQYPFDIEIKNSKYFDAVHPFYYTNERLSSDFLINFYNKNLKVIEDKDIHLLSFIGHDLRYESSYPSSKFFAQYCQGNKRFEELKLATKEKFIITTGDPGIGKTALLEHAANFLKTRKESQICWIIFISLNECQKMIRKLNSLNNIETVVDFFSKCENCEDQFSKRILKRFLLSEPRLCVFFDGFDEIHKPKDRIKIIELLKFLGKETVIKQVWISSRLHFVDELEEALGVVSFEIEDITENEQIKLVSELWKISCQTSSLYSTFDVNSTKLIRSFNSGTNNQDRKFLGIPLHTFMLAIAFEGEAKSTTPNYPEQIGLVRLYEYFFKRKYDIFFADKVGTPEILKGNVINLYETQHQKFAIEYSGIISSEETEILSKIVSCNYELDNLKRIGLIHQCGNDLQFVHRTFAEYLIAGLFSSNLETYTKEILNVIKNILLKKGNGFILYIFDTMLTDNLEEYKVQSSIINGQLDLIVPLNDKALNAKDYLGRGCFYYSLHYRQFNIISFLISRNIDVHFERFLVDVLYAFRWQYYHEAILHSRERDENTSDEIKLFSKRYTELFEYILDLEVHKIPSTVVNSFSLNYEANLKHWNILAKLMDKFNQKIMVYGILELCVYRTKIFKAPVEVLLLTVFKSADSISLREDEEGRYNILKENAYYDVFNGLLNCELNHLIIVVTNYGDVVAKLSSHFHLMVDLYYKLHELCRLSPYMLHITVISEYINYIKLKSENFAVLSKFLLENGASPCLVEGRKNISGEKDLVTSSHYLGSTDYSSIYFLSPYKINWSYPIRRLGSIKAEGREKFFLKDLRQLLGGYMFICSYDENTTIYNALVLITNRLLEESDGIRMIRLIKKFHENVANNNLEGASFVFEEAKRRNWAKVISMATNEKKHNAKEMLQNLCERISDELDSIKEELRKSQTK